MYCGTSWWSGAHTGSSCCIQFLPPDRLMHVFWRVHITCITFLMHLTSLSILLSTAFVLISSESTLDPHRDNILIRRPEILPDGRRRCSYQLLFPDLFYGFLFPTLVPDKGLVSVSGNSSVHLPLIPVCVVRRFEQILSLFSPPPCLVQ